ncbi:MAG: hypothetical protein Q9180_004666 [Flavoplaca navasiana]
MGKNQWPPIRTAYPNDALDQLQALRSDFQHILGFAKNKSKSSVPISMFTNFAESFLAYADKTHLESYTQHLDDRLDRLEATAASNQTTVALASSASAQTTPNQSSNQAPTARGPRPRSVEIREEGARDRIRRMDPETRLQEVQTAVGLDPEVAAAFGSDPGPMAEGQCQKRVISTRQLKSGDVEIHTLHIEDVDILVQARQWVTIFGAGAKAVSSTFSVVAQSVQVKNVNIKGEDNVRSTAQAIVAANALKWKVAGELHPDEIITSGGLKTKHRDPGSAPWLLPSGP